VRISSLNLVPSFLIFWHLAAYGAPPPGTDFDSPTHEWFEGQFSVNRDWCCNVSDGHILADNEWRQDTDHYSVRIKGVWYPIEAASLRDPAGGPNPTGSAIAWYNVDVETGAVKIYCFAPGVEY
jgi:hypothetical protein